MKHWSSDRTRSTTRGILISLVAAMLAVPAFAATYYVDINTGDDAHTAIQAQNPATPWRTLTHAEASAPGGTPGSPTTIQVAAGIYSTGAGESLPITFSQPDIEIIGSGISTTTLTTGFKTGGGSSRDTILLEVQAPGFAISGFTFRAASQAIILNTGGADIHDNFFATDSTDEIRTAITLVVIDRSMTNSLTIDPVVVRNNTIQATSEGLFVYFGFDLLGSDNTLSIGDLIVENNTFELTGYAQGVEINGVSIENGVGARVSVGEIRISGNEFTGGNTAIETQGKLEQLVDCEVLTGPLTITNNQFLMQDYKALDLDLYDLDSLEETTTCTLGGLTFSGNTIDAPDAAGLLVDEIGGFRIFSGKVHVMIGPISVTDNTITAGLFDGLGMDMGNFGSIARQSLGDVTISNNTITTTGNANGLRLSFGNIGAAALENIDIHDNVVDAAARGMDISHQQFGNQLHMAGSFISGTLDIRGNTVTSGNEIGVRVMYGLAGYGSNGESHTEIGPLVMRGNQITAPNDVGLWLHLVNVASALSGGAVVVTGDQVIGGPEVDHVNTITGGTEAIRIDLIENGWGNLESSSASMGDIHIENNTLISGNGHGIGVHSAAPGEGAGDQALVSLPSVLAKDNDIDAALNGVLVDEILAADLYGQPIVRLGGYSVVANSIGAGSYTPGHGVWIRRSWTTDPFAGTSDTSEASLGDILVADNEITDVVENGIHVEIERFGDLFGESCRLNIGGIEITGNLIDGTGYGIRAALAGSSRSNAIVEGGRLEILSNTISNIDPGGSGIVVRHELQNDDTSTMVLPGAVLRGNTIFGAGLHGIHVSRSVVQNGGSLVIGPPLIESNTVEGWGGGLGLTDVPGAQVFGNALSDNDNGILIEGLNDGVSIRRNNINDNTDFGAANIGSHWIDGEDNWWGDVSGPYDPIGTVEVPPETSDPTQEKNTDGLGNDVSEGIDYCMWSLQPRVLPYVFADGFERGDLSRWDTSKP